MSTLGAWDLFKAALSSAARNPGDVGATLRDFKNSQDRQAYRTRMLAKIAALGMDLEAQRIKALEWQAKRLAEGHSVNIETTHQTCTFLDEYLAIVRYHQGGEEGKVDVFYGGRGAPMGTGHGHVVVRKGRVTFWRTPMPDAQVLVNE